MESHSVQILAQIFILFAAAKVLGVVGERAKVPAVISEIVAGILIGPHLLRLVQVEEWTLALAELGAIVLLFDVGLDQKLTDLAKVGWTALLEAIILGDGGPAHTEIVRLLLAAGARHDIADAQGVTPLAHARQRGQGPIVGLLLAAERR